MFRQASGLSDAISEQLTALGSLPPLAIALVLSFMIAAVTNITSNSATATLFLPIVGKLVRTNPSIFVNSALST